MPDWDEDGPSYVDPGGLGTGTLQLRVANMTDLAGNPLSTSLDNTTINVVAKAIGVTGGDFEVPTLPALAQPGDIPLWFDNTEVYADWQNSTGYTTSGSQSAFLQWGYMYQSLGQLQAGTATLDWSFDHVRYTLGGVGAANLRFFYGVSPYVGEGADIDTLGLTQIGSTINIPAVTTSDASRSGSVDVSSVPAGSTIWVDFTHTSGYFLLDNIAVTGGGSSGSPYASWATGSQPFDGDANGDGVDDGLAWFLTAATPSANALDKLPVVAKDGSFLTLDFQRVNPYAPAKLYVQFGNDLSGWTEVEIPATSGTITLPGDDVEVLVTSPGTPTPDSVTVKIPASYQSASGSLFARLRATAN